MVIGWILPVVGAALAIATLSWLYQGIDLERFLTAVVGLKLQGQLTGARHQKIRRPVLITEGMAADDDGFCPPRHQPRDVFADDRLAEDGAADDIAQRSVRRTPHLFGAEFLDRVGGVDGDLVVGVVAAGNRQIAIFQVHI